MVSPRLCIADSSNPLRLKCNLNGTKTKEETERERVGCYCYSLCLGYELVIIVELEKIQLTLKNLKTFLLVMQDCQNHRE